MTKVIIKTRGLFEDVVFSTELTVQELRSAITVSLKSPDPLLIIGDDIKCYFIPTADITSISIKKVGRN